MRCCLYSMWTFTKLASSLAIMQYFWIFNWKKFNTAEMFRMPKRNHSSCRSSDEDSLRWALATRWNPVGQSWQFRKWVADHRRRNNRRLYTEFEALSGSCRNFHGPFFQAHQPRHPEEQLKRLEGVHALGWSSYCHATIDNNQSDYCYAAIKCSCPRNFKCKQLGFTLSCGLHLQSLLLLIYIL